MTALGYKRTSPDVRVMSALPPKADIAECPLSANSRRRPAYSITWSARPSTESGTVRPNAFAASRLMTSSIFVASCTGRSTGFSPLRIRPV
jgi:hypothetical protein